MGQSSQVHWVSGIDILKTSSNFYILLVLLRGAIPENFSSIAHFVQILWAFEYFRVHLIFLVHMRIFFQFWEAITRNSQTKPWKIFPWIYAHVTIGNSSKHRVLGTWNFFYRYSKIRKKLKTYIYSKKSRILIIFFFFKFTKCFYL